MTITGMYPACRYLPWFLESTPSEACAKGGAGAYNTALKKDSKDPTGVWCGVESVGVFQRLPGFLRGNAWELVNIKGV
jgi:hypothetical protein